ncbi:MAG TPA: autotransporter-associated beta strand repeat-containing protein [Opitutaceae bacterium]|jgi:fibronectin-binding autotransporter adhesin|nr:autotransporter-associated beta strand repeat-containing protein [Opitutaceae bacterium]
MLVLPCNPSVRRLLSAAAAAIFILAGQANGQVITVNQSFTGSTAPGWNFGGNGVYTPTLSNTSSGLTLTTSVGNEATYAYDTSSFASANATIAVKFQYSASSGTAQPADGMTFFLADAATIGSSGFSPGAYGGSLGYAQKTSAGTGGVSGGSTNINGMNGGYLGLGLDEFGNYSNGTEGRIGGINTPNTTPNAIAVRGPGSGLTGYDYLGGTAAGSVPNFSAGTSATPVVTNFELTISATNQVVVYMDESGVYTQVFTADLSGYTRPNNLILGFTGSTGGANSTQQISNVILTSVPANLWTNIYGAANGTTNSGNWSSTAGSGSSTTSNWVNGAVPADQSPGTPADVLLDNTYVSTAQTINVGNGVGANQVIRALQIDAPFSYTLNGGSIEFNNENNGNTVLGPSGIFVSQTHGSATQTINSNLSADNAIEIKNGSGGALNLTGNLANGGNTVTLDGTGTGVTTLSGIVSGTGAIVKNDSGNDTLSGANTYSGGTTLNAGTLTADHNTVAGVSGALGTGGLTINGGTLSSDSNNTVGNAITLQGNAKFNNVTTSGTLTQTGGSLALTMDGATQSGTVNLSNNNTAQTLTVNVDSGSSSTISGVIQNGGTSAGNLTKNGTGTLTLSGTDTYSGTTTINAGTLALGASNVLATTSNLNIAGGTFNLNKNSDKVNNLTFSNGGTIDFGAGSTSNSFVFNNLTPAPSGVLTINNYNGSDSSSFPGAGSGDFLGTLTPTIAAATLNQIYFSGYGTGSLENTVQTAAGNGLGNAYRIAPTVISWGPYTWTSNSSQNWGNNANWQGATAPPNTANPTNVFVDFGTGTQSAVSFNANSTINALRFDSSAIAYTITDSGTHTLTLQNGTSLAFVQQQSAHNEVLDPVNIVLKNNTVFDVTGAGSLTVGSNISGAFSVTKTGSGGTLILSGPSTYTGGTSIQTGTVQMQNTTALGTGTATVSNGATLQLANGISPTNAVTISGTGTGTNGALENVSGSNTLSGAVTLGGASRINSDAGTLTLSGGITGSGNNLNLGGAGNTTVSSAITTGAGTVTLDGTGTTTFSGAANTYTGLTTVNSGTLSLNKAANTAAIAGDLTINAGTVNEAATGQFAATSNLTVNGGTFAITGGTGDTLNSVNTSSGSTVSMATGSTLTISSSGTSTLNGVVSGAGALDTSGTGNITLAGSNTYSGGSNFASTVRALNNNSLGTGAATISSGGNLQLQNNVTLGNNFTLNSTGTSSVNGAIENISGTNGISGTVTLSGNSRVQSDSGTLTFSNNVGLGANTLNVGGNSNTTISGVISGTGPVTKDGTGTLTLSGANTFTGTTAVSAGTLTAGAANVLNTTTGVTVSSGATLNINNFNQTVANLNNSGALSFGSTGGETLTLTGTNTLGGTMTGAVGTLLLGAGTTLTLGANFSDPSLNIILAGGTLNLNGTTDVFDNLTVTGSSTIDFASAANSILTVNSIGVSSGMQLSVNNWSNNADFFYSNIDPSAQGTAPIDQIVFDSPTYTGSATKWMSYIDGPGSDHQVTPVPEPATYGAIFTGACLGFFLLSRLPRRKPVVVKVSDRRF